jgi:hypothetical protein
VLDYQDSRIIKCQIMCLPLLLVIVVSVRVVTFFAYDVGLAFLPLLVELLEMTLWTCVLDSWDLF